MTLAALAIGVGLWMAPQALAAAPAPCHLAGPAPAIPRIRLASVTRGLTSPVGLVHAGDGSNRLFVIEQAGIIRVVKDGRVAARPFLDIRDRVVAGGEMGLLGLAFHPHVVETRRVFVNYTSPEGGLHTVIAEFLVSERAGAEHADSAGERILLTIRQPFANHNGGHLAFGPDGLLYIGTGDGGGANDPLGNGRNLATLLGKMLRIDVDRQEGDRAYGIPFDNPFVGRKGARPEVWAYGLRNPWRYSFDPVTGRLYAGDVGQVDREEIDIIKRGRHYGWNIMEGMICTPGVNPHCNKKGLERPILDYPRSEGTVVIGGSVYRGQAIPDLCGMYVYADFGNGRLFGLRYDGRSVTHRARLLETGRSISAIGEDEQRELYVVDYAGEVLKIVGRQEQSR